MALGLCIVAAGKTTVVAASLFTLSWVHSVERIEWRETYAVSEAGLVLREARVKGSGAGMEPGEDARLVGDWWVWQPKRPPIPELDLAASGATVSAWTLCSKAGCMELGASAEAPISLKPCPAEVP
ncbi:hypothetical protein HDIA_4538 [Hartmannibacter diazotrophicus]|uniref:DUF1850 domain-containing protein n=1 Tax=Hartmannibacter diazotrophicus TaxID=1482074 RepID=A0A2C9DD31_9HYPH|nr:DUF1850 domain-containing protein [Hartmannibacter diazotrophicus]SON58079.1 hypothetical protein HDIA_4538 [Hartmannibacter diazotrophicus]